MHNKSNNILTKKQVVFFCKKYAPHIGGVETHVAHISQKLKQKYEIQVITEQHNSVLPLYESMDGVEIFRIPHHTQSKFGVWMWMVCHITLFLRADIMHAHDVGWWYLPLRILLCWKPLYTTFHGYEGYREPSMGALISRKIVELLSVRVLCVGAWMREWYKQHPWRVIYGAAACSPKPLPQTYSAVFIGRLSHDTGILSYIKAVQALQGKLSLDIYGEGSLQREVERKIAKSPYITYKGVTQQSEKELQYHRFAFVSRYLGMIEAQNVGRLVFAQWDSHIKKSYLETFPSACYTVTFHDTSELVSEIKYVIQHPCFEKKCITKAQQWAHEQTWNHIARTYEELWHA